MYLVTFYSFKGGVGRTMAMANVGARLAQAGRKVLMVDFDLEAPGLGTFNFPKPDSETPGVVEFVNEYLETNRAPKVKDYLYQSPGFGEDGGELWIMPAGIQDEGYAGKFAQIDWQELYAKRNGFLLMEDLKQQWQEQLKVDYVLLDSRTGHSDVVGICTRQLPDAVVLMMFPNMQNLVGLRKVTSDIKKHEALPGATKIRQHFVVSNVPDLDDEDQILENTFEQFRIQLGYEKPSAIIHRYQSLALLNQDVFSITRPRTRLADEYKQLTDEIVLYNDEDKEGAVNYLTRALRLQRPEFRDEQFKADEIELRVKNLREQHSEDTKILFLLGQFNYRQGSEEDALALYEEAEKLGMKSAALYIAMTRVQDSINDKTEALKSLKKVLGCEDASYFDLIVAVRMLSKLDSTKLALIAESPALVSMESDDQIQVANQLAKVKGGFKVSEEIIGRIRGSSKDLDEEDDKASAQILALGLIEQKRYAEAIDEIIGSSEPDLNSLDIGEVFNLAMAKWGLEGSPDIALFEQVVKKDKEDTKSKNLNKNLNYVQCLAISNFVVGDIEEAKARLKRAKVLSSKLPARGYSAWSYSEENQRTFKEHLLEMQEMIEGKDVLPRFLSQQKKLKNSFKKSIL